MTKNCIFRHEFYKNCSKSQFHENTDENLTYMSSVCHLTTLPLWILLRQNNIFVKKFKVERKFICAEFQIFST